MLPYSCGNNCLVSGCLDHRCLLSMVSLTVFLQLGKAAGVAAEELDRLQQGGDRCVTSILLAGGRLNRRYCTRGVCDCGSALDLRGFPAERKPKMRKRRTLGVHLSAPLPEYFTCPLPAASAESERAGQSRNRALSATSDSNGYLWGIHG